MILGGLLSSASDKNKLRASSRCGCNCAACTCLNGGYHTAFFEFVGTLPLQYSSCTTRCGVWRRLKTVPLWAGPNPRQAQRRRQFMNINDFIYVLTSEASVQFSIHHRGQFTIFISKTLCYFIFENFAKKNEKVCCRDRICRLEEVS